jgi:CarD family transcriptional regulator
MTKSKKKAPARKPAAKAKAKQAPKKVSRPVKPAKAKPAASRPVAPKAAAKAAPAKTVSPKLPRAKPTAPKPSVAAKPKTQAQAKPVAIKPSAHRLAEKSMSKAQAKPVAEKERAAPAAMPQAEAQPRPVPAPTGRQVMSGPVVATPAPKKLSFKVSDLIVYPAHGVGKVIQIEEQEIAGAKLELYIVDFEKEKLRLKVPTGRAEQKGMRRLSDRAQIEQALRVLKGRARIKRTMWSRRAQEYDAKINSGDLISVAEVVRDLYRSERQPEQSYSERQLFEQALERMAREIAAVRKIDDDQSIRELEEYLSKNAKRTPVPGEKAEEDVPSEEAA